MTGSCDRRDDSLSGPRLGFWGFRVWGDLLNWGCKRRPAVPHGDEDKDTLGVAKAKPGERGWDGTARQSRVAGEAQVEEAWGRGSGGRGSPGSRPSSQGCTQPEVPAWTTRILAAAPTQ